MEKKKVDLSLPIVEVDTQLGKGNCLHLEECEWYERQMEEKLVGRYIARGQPFEGQIVAARLHLRSFTFESYLAKVKKIHKGRAWRPSCKAERQGYFCEPFLRELFIPDIVEINHSKEVRSGGPMRGAYLSSIEDMGGAPTEYVDLKLPDCCLHYDYWWGIFALAPGYKQGGVVVNKKLLAYIRLRRNGNYVLYAQILGHGDYLQYGIMYRLHLAILEWAFRGGDGLTLGLEHLVYGGYYQGTDGLTQWKKNTLFEPAYLVISQANGRDVAG